MMDTILYRTTLQGEDRVQVKLVPRYSQPCSLKTAVLCHLSSSSLTAAVVASLHLPQVLKEELNSVLADKATVAEV